LILKGLATVIAVLALLAVAYLLHARLVANPKVVEELRSNPTGARAARVALLTFADGSAIPVNYLREGNKVFIGADGLWWREFRDGGAAVSVLIRGETHTGRAFVVLDDPRYVEDVFSRLRPTVPKWLPDWLNGKLVVVTLDTNGTAS